MIKRRILTGWILLVVVAVAWCGVVIFNSVHWTRTVAMRVPEGEIANVWGMNLKAVSLYSISSIKNPNGTEEVPSPGAVFVIAVMEYSSDSGTVHCSITLAGDRRHWDSSRNWFIEYLEPGSLSYCNTTDNSGEPTRFGKVAGIFEIPESALDEIQGLEVHLVDPTRHFPHISASRIVILAIHPQ